jgi:hypothetical protein
MPQYLTPRSLLRGLILWALLCLFLLGGITNILQPEPIQLSYARWGYPDWLPYVAGLMELAAALLLMREKTRDLGVIIGGFVMGGALVTLLIHHEFAHALAPTTALIALPLSLYLDEKAREARWEGKAF